MPYRTLDDLDLAGRSVLVRVDLNVPVDAGRVTDTTRIARIVPTLRDIRAAGGRAVLLAHFGRPKGRTVASMSLRVIVPALEAALGAPVTFLEAPDRAAIDALPQDAVALLENTRFHPGEEANDPDLAARLAALGDVFVNDAFSAAHRAHASTEGVARLLPAAAGRLMAAELRALEAALGTPRRPVGAVVGGAKVSTKIALLYNLVGRLDVLIIGGGMANTFLAALGADLGASMREDDQADTARGILARAETTGCRVLLPRDGRVTTNAEGGAGARIVEMSAETRLADDQRVLDAGPQTEAAIAQTFEGLATLIWNGPLGVFEMPPFDTATRAAARHAATLTAQGRLVTVAGGGDTVAALNATGVAEAFSYVSTAGGAFLEWMEGKTLPGVAALQA